MGVLHLENKWAGKSLVSMMFVLAGPYDSSERAILHLKWLSSGCVVLGALALNLNKRADVHPSPSLFKSLRCAVPPHPFSTTNSYPTRLAVAQLKTESIGALANNIDQGTHGSRPIASGSHFVASSPLNHPKTVVDDLSWRLA